MPELTDPDTPEEWQNAVDAAYAWCAIDSAHRYGLVAITRYGGAQDGATLTESGVNVDRCRDILERGAALGYRPADDAIDRLVAEINAEAAS